MKFILFFPQTVMVNIWIIKNMRWEKNSPQNTRSCWLSREHTWVPLFALVALGSVSTSLTSATTVSQATLSGQSTAPHQEQESQSVKESFELHFLSQMPQSYWIAFSAHISGICCPFGNTWLCCYCQQVCSNWRLNQYLCPHTGLSQEITRN